MLEQRLISVALVSRLCIILLQFISNVIIPDHNAHVFQFPRSNSETNYVSSFLNYTLNGFIRWDGEYFMHIAKYGYTYENTLAFFPLYPYLVHYITKIIEIFIPILDFDVLLLIVFILCNIIFFVLSSKVLYQLTLLLFNRTIAYKTLLLFCFNPASIFFTAPYSECLFCYLSFQSAYFSTLLVRKYGKTNSVSFKDMKILIYISLSTLVRSNGLFNIGFVVYPLLCSFVSYFPKKKLSILNHILKFIFMISGSFIVSALPFMFYQIYCYKNFCNDFHTNLPYSVIDYASENGFVLPGQFSKFNQTWCNNRIPLAYSYVQDHYWNVGFLRYYEFKQIPNFLLALPCLFIAITNCLLHFKSNSKNLVNIFNLTKINSTKNKSIIFNLNLTMFVVHLFALSIICTFFIHIQVSTRMICSATPLFYWYCAYYSINGWEALIKLYFYSYVIVGTILFCNFLPWT